MSKFCIYCQYRRCRMQGNKKAGEYSEEDTHRPAHHYREVVACRTFGGIHRAVGKSLPRERDALNLCKVPQLDDSILSPDSARVQAYSGLRL